MLYHISMEILFPGIFPTDFIIAQKANARKLIFGQKYGENSQFTCEVSNDN